MQRLRLPSGPAAAASASRPLARSSRRAVRAAAAPQQPPASAEDMAPAGCERVRITLRKPLGLVLESNSKTGDIFVVEVVPEGSAAKDGRIEVRRVDAAAGRRQR